MHDMDDETRREVLGEALMDELKAIREYVQDVPTIKADVRQVKLTVDEIKDRLGILESVVREHDRELRELKPKAA
jgi:2-phospho-L-lactate guanylyltransferase (CobY/MobA/RfbA family)